MTFAKPSWLAAALVGAENAACVLAVTSQTVFYATPDGPFATGLPVRNDRTPFQMTVLHTAVGALLFADQTPLGWLDPGSEIEDDDWPTIAMRTGLNPPETSPVPMGLDVAAPMTPEPEPVPGFADVVTAMEKASGADLSHLLADQPPGIRADPDVDESTRIAEADPVEPFVVILIDNADEDYSSLFVSEDAEALRRIQASDPGSGGAWDDVLFAVTATMRAMPVATMYHQGWWDDRAERFIADRNIPADRVFRGTYS